MLPPELTQLLDELNLSEPVPIITNETINEYCYVSREHDFRILFYPNGSHKNAEGKAFMNLAHIMECGTMVGNDFSVIRYAELVEDTKSQLRRWGYPVDAILRMKRLRALLSY